MGIVSLIAIIVIASVIIKKKGVKVIANPLFLFTFLWLIIVALNILNLYGFYQIDNIIYVLIGIGVFSFFAGHKIAPKINLKSKKERKKQRYLLNKKLVYFLCAICLIYFSIDFFKSTIMLINGTSLDEIRVMIQNSNNNVKILNFLHNFVFLPSAFALEAVSVAELYRGKKSKVLFICNIIIILFRVIGDAGRTPLFNLILYLIIGYLVSLYNKEKAMQIKEYIRKYKKVLIVLLIVLLIITILRSSSGLFRLTYIYFAMPPNLFNYWKNYIDANSIMTLGITSFNGIFFTINYFVKNIFTLDSYLPIISQSYNLIALTDSQWIALMPGQTTANAYVSLFLFFYADFGIPGIIILSLLFGMYARKVFERVLSTDNPRDLALYFLLMQSIFFSFIRFYFAKAYFVIAIVLIYILYLKKENVKDENESK